MRTFVITIFIAFTYIISLNVYGQAALDDSAPKPSAVGFKTVSDALESLKSTPGVDITTTKPDGWTIANDSRNYAQWSFTPPGHYAYPAVVKRIIKQSADGNVFIQMTALCQAEKSPCDRLIEEFEQLNERIRQSTQRRLQEQGRTAK
jgi:hypothetical protein